MQLPPALLAHYPEYPKSSSFPKLDQYSAPLTDEITEDGKSLVNPPRSDGRKSKWYDKVWDGEPGAGGRSWWDFHVYHVPNNPVHVKYARELHEAVRREFPELRVYKFWDRPIGPHPIPMFEVNVFNPLQLGTLLSWFAAHRGPCSVLIHPNTGLDVPDHTTNATWLGEKVVLDVDMLKAFDAKKAAASNSPK